MTNHSSKSSLSLDYLNARSRRLNLQEISRNFIAFLEDNNYTFSEIIEAFSNYALKEIGKIPCEKRSWEIVSAVLKF